ncbi:MAG: 4-hydroxy-tetrahydrodipicolinate synthase [Gammaproteobacteria bacterium]
MLRGSIVALVTPMLEDGSLDLPALQRLIDWHVTQGTDGIVIAGTTGEAPTLSTSEQLTLISHAVGAAAGRVPVVAGTGSNSTRETVELTREAARLGVEAALLVVPYYNKPTQEGLYRHFAQIARSIELPQILYNVPGRTITDLEPETICRLAKIPGIVGIKEASGDLARVALLREGTRPDFLLLSGDDPSACEFMLAGGDGVISVTANAAPAAMHALCEAALSGHAEEAETLDKALVALHEGLFFESNPIPVKWALHRMGQIGPDLRLPLTPLSDKYHSKLDAILNEAGLL